MVLEALRNKLKHANRLKEKRRELNESVTEGGQEICLKAVATQSRALSGTP